MTTEIPGTKDIVLQPAAQQLGPQAFETVNVSNVTGKTPETTETLPAIPTCITQDSTSQNLEPDPAAIIVGVNSEIPRWECGSIVAWTTCRKGYNSEADADYVAQQFGQAAKKWNEAEVGVTFQNVAVPKDANFVVCYGGDKGSMLSKAFFPNGNDLNHLFVYSYAFQPDWRPSLSKVLTHELGHVLGLRHEFAMDCGKMLGGKAVQFGQRNPLSVMSYRQEPPEIQPSDIVSTKEFYNLPEGFQLSGIAVKSYVPK